MKELVFSKAASLQPATILKMKSFRDIFYPYSGWVFSGLLLDGLGGRQKTSTLLKVRYIYPVMMKLSTVILSIKKIRKNM